MGVLVQQHSTTLQYTTEVGCHSGEWYHRSRNHLLPGQQGKSQHALGAQGNNYSQAQCATTILPQHSHTCNDPPNTTTTTIWASGQLSLRLFQVSWGLIALTSNDVDLGSSTPPPDMLTDHVVFFIHLCFAEKFDYWRYMSTRGVNNVCGHVLYFPPHEY